MGEASESDRSRDWRTLADAGDLEGARTSLSALPPPTDPAATLRQSSYWAELEERCGDALWFHARPGAGVHYRAAQGHLLSRTLPPITDFAESRSRQEAWTRIADKLLYGSLSDGSRRPGATGRPHPAGDPPATPPPLPVPDPPPLTIPDSPPPPIPDSPPDPPISSPPRAEAPPHRPDPSEARPPEPAHQTSQAAPPEPKPPRAPSPPRDDYRSYGHLHHGQRYRITESFVDFDGKAWSPGTVLQYDSYNYFPYDEGPTLYTDRGTIRLCGLFDDQEQLMRRLDEVLVRVADSEGPPKVFP